MDFTAMAFYALVCGGLGAVVPRFDRFWIRFGVAALVGIAAAAVLPLLRGVLGI
ncbi:MAG: hypothetical protein MRY75_00650 [Marivita sp.]|uniref:hypothetical protein n=1 Tax=Marivita sp. TaxID=2003365 RepID=UPI0025C15A5F|nr:hypothetical protein [Marivita sp.]MCI5109035.1 hypothetical protein [Marivita sp.]